MYLFDFYLLIIEANISSLVKWPLVKLFESHEDVHTQEIFCNLLTMKPQRPDRNCFTQKQTTPVSSHPAEHQLMRQEGCMRTAHFITTYSRRSTYIYMSLQSGLRATQDLSTVSQNPNPADPIHVGTVQKCSNLISLYVATLQLKCSAVAACLCSG